jgi:hypothetical protein
MRTSGEGNHPRLGTLPLVRVHHRNLTRRGAIKALVIGAASTASCAPGWSQVKPKPASNQRQSPRAGNKAPVWLTLPNTPDLPVPSRTDHLTVNGTRIFFAQFGSEGRPHVLLLHGGLANRTIGGFRSESLPGIFPLPLWIRGATAEVR